MNILQFSGKYGDVSSLGDLYQLGFKAWCNFSYLTCGRANNGVLFLAFESSFYNSHPRNDHFNNFLIKILLFILDLLLSTS